MLIIDSKSEVFEIASDTNTEVFEVLEDNIPVFSGESQSYARWMWEGIFHSHKVASQVGESQPVVTDTGF